MQSFWSSISLFFFVKKGNFSLIPVNMFAFPFLLTTPSHYLHTFLTHLGFTPFLFSWSTVNSTSSIFFSGSYLISAFLLAKMLTMIASTPQPFTFLSFSCCVGLCLQSKVKVANLSEGFTLLNFFFVAIFYVGNQLQWLAMIQ